MHTSGDETVSGARHGGFERFYDREYEGQVRRAYVLLRSNELATDVVQDAMLGVLRRWDELESPGGYLARAVLNGCRDVGRRQASQRRLIDRLRPAEVGPTAEDRLDDVLSTLAFNHRAAVVLRYYAGLSTDEIAAALGCRPGSVGPWIDRALSWNRDQPAGRGRPAPPRLS